MSARSTILDAIARAPRAAAAHPGPYTPPAAGDELIRFQRMAQNAAAEVHLIANAAQIPTAIGDILRAKNLPARIHLPADSPLAAMLPALMIQTTPPGPDDVTVSTAPFAIAETGTLAFAAGPGAPASWHFRAGCEIALLRADNILPSMEDVLLRMTPLPSTLNFITGPSRTGDIEQTLELGAHGPKALIILIVTD